MNGYEGQIQSHGLLLRLSGMKTLGQYVDANVNTERLD